jgi:DNA-directed RNA polymerase subunit RPC12/RpoP
MWQHALFMTWIIIAMLGCTMAIVILYRRGRRGVIFALMCAGGTIAAGPLLAQRMPESVLVGSICLVIAGLSLFGLRRPRMPRAKCWNCGYDFAGETETSSAVCPECGEVRATLTGHCRSCRKDISQAIAGGSDTCPHCEARIPPPSRKLDHFRRR